MVFPPNSGSGGNSKDLGYFPSVADFPSTASTGSYGVADSTNTVWYMTATGYVDSGLGAIGDVNGPVASSDNRVARFNGETGKLIQQSPVTIDDSGNVNIPTGMTYQINGVDLAYGDVGAPALLHYDQHGRGGSDMIRLDALNYPTDNTILNTSAASHGLCPKLSGNGGQFLAGDGSWKSPSGSGDVLGPSSNADGYVPVWSGTDSKTLDGGFAVSAFATTVLDDTTAAAMRTTLELGSSSTLNVGTGASDVSAGNHAHTAYVAWSSEVDTDIALTANSNLKVSTQAAVKAYVDNKLGVVDAMLYKGAFSCGANPNYPAADAGHTYKVSGSGKIGGSSGVNVEVGDILICCVDGTASGSQASVGANWDIIQTNIDGAVSGPTSSTANNLVTFDGTTGRLIKDSTFPTTALVPTGGSTSQVLTKSSNTSYDYTWADLTDVGYSSVATTATLPASPDTGEIYEFIGTGANWTLTANTGQYIRMLSTVSVVGGTIASTSEYDTVCLIYIGSNVWLVKSSMGILEVT